MIEHRMKSGDKFDICLHQYHCHIAYCVRGMTGGLKRHTVSPDIKDQIISSLGLCLTTIRRIEELQGILKRYYVDPHGQYYIPGSESLGIIP